MKFFAMLLASLLFYTVTIQSIVTAAPSENLVIMQLQTGGNGSGTASQEFILLYNSSDLDINITDWCLEYSSASNGLTFNTLSCVETADDRTEIWLSADGYATFSTSEFKLANPGFTADFTFSAGIAGAGGHVKLVDHTQQEIDRVGWGSAVNAEGSSPAPTHSAGELLTRNSLAPLIDTDSNLADFSSEPIMEEIVGGLYEQETIIDACPNLEDVQNIVPEGYGIDESGMCKLDVCLNLDGLQVALPEGYQKLVGSDECSLIPLENAVIFITELLPNAPSLDTGQEFIELYNPNNRAVNLEGYRLQIGPGFTKEYVFTSRTINPGQFIVVSDSETGVVLPNSTGQQLRVISPAGNTVSSSSAYVNADDDVSWALVEDQWIFTNQITRGSANKPYLEPAVDEVQGTTSVLAPCAAGKFRNPETNRCKTIATGTSQLVPCDADETRNPETNRCRKTSTATSDLVPCEEGQERNPDTNRCRNVASVLSDATELPQIVDVKTVSTAGQINWSVIVVAIIGTIGYMVYEWRSEIQHRFAR